MEFLPKLFANKFSPYISYAFLKLFALLLGVGLFGSILSSVSQLLGEVVFFTGSAFVMVMMMGFASVKHYEEKAKFAPTNPILLQILASSTINCFANAISSISKVLFIIVFYLFLSFAVLTILFPFAARWYGS